jgi:adenosine deaminase
MIQNNLPLIDLHRHLDGAIRIETLIDLGRQHNLPLPSFDIEELRPHVQITEPTPDLMSAIAKFKWYVGVLVDYETCRRISYENVINAENEGLDYVELRFSPWFMAEPHGLDPASVVAAVVEGIQEARLKSSTKVNLIGTISRTYGTEIGMVEVNAFLTKKEEFVAMDLAGDEVNFPAEWFEPHFNKGRDAGWEVTVHAGEAAGPESVWQALQVLGASRIGHATRIDEDPVLVEYMLENRIGIEANLTSNLQISAIDNLMEHPLKGWLDIGLLAMINTDNPMISNVDITHELTVAAPAAGLTSDDTRKAQENALTIAFLSDQEKQSLKRM